MLYNKHSEVTSTELEKSDSSDLFGGFNIHFTHGNSKARSVHGDGKIKTDGYGFTARVKLSRGASLLGRLGVALDYDKEWNSTQGKKNHSNFYGIANLEYEFLNGTSV